MHSGRPIYHIETDALNRSSLQNSSEKKKEKLWNSKLMDKETSRK